jgi:hypothetical protein
MTKSLTIIILVLMLSSCTYQPIDSFQNKQLYNTSLLTTVVQDSIDKYGFSGCSKPYNYEVQDYCLKALDSAWTLLLRNNKTNEASRIYSKERFKDALINDGFVVDTSGDWITAAKTDFNERWRADWGKDSTYVKLVVTRWYKGYTYDFVIGSNNFDK